MDLNVWKFSEATKALKCEASSHSVETSVSNHTRFSANAVKVETYSNRTDAMTV